MLHGGRGYDALDMDKQNSMFAIWYFYRHADNNKAL